MQFEQIQPITKAEGLLPLVRAIESAQEVCLDTEADSMHHYFEKVCLLQFTVEGNAGDSHFLVDPLSGVDARPVFDSLKDKPLVLHGADYDLRMLKRDFDFVPERIFDTMLAARLTGHEKIGLEALVEKYAGAQLDHGMQKADWSQRPLPPRLLKYAVEDTAHLPLIAQRLREELSTLGRLEWHRQQCQQLIETCAAAPQKNGDDAWRIKGSFPLDRQSLSILRELWLWRDAEARGWDRPPFMVLSNEKLLALTIWAVQHPHENLRKFDGLPKRWHERRHRTLEVLLDRAKELPESKWPEPAPRGKRPPYNPRFYERLNRLRGVRDHIAKELHLNPAIIATTAMLESIADKCPRGQGDFAQVEGWLPWQTDLLGKDFLKALHG